MGVIVVSKVYSYSMFVLSFIPLWISILFIDVVSIIQSRICIYTEVISIVIIVIIIVGSIIVYCRFTQIHKSEIHCILISSAEEKTGTTEFLLSNIMPLAAFDFTQWTGALLFLFYLGIMMNLCMRHNYLSFNVFLELIGYKYYKCELSIGGEIIVMTVISRKNLLSSINSEMHLCRVNNEYCIFRDQ